jgi:hypothetical protein
VTRFARRWVCVCLFAFAATATAQVRRGADETPNADTLKRLAQQLGAGGQTPPNIDPELMKAAQKYLEMNPDILNDPSFQKQVQQWQQQAKENPAAFEQLMKQQNPNISPEQIDSLKKQFQQSKPNGFQPPPSIGPQPQPNPSPTGPKPQPQPAPQPGNPNLPQPTPWQPGQQPPWQPNISGQGQGNQSAAQKAQAKEEYHQVVGMWENSFGDIDNTPALKQSLIDMFSGDGTSPFSGQGNGNSPMNGGGNKPGGQKPWWDTGDGSNGGSNNGFVNWLKNTSSNPPTWWKNFTNWQNTSPPPNMGAGLKPPQASGSFGSPGFSGGGDIGGVATPVVFVVALLAAAVAAFVLWRYWPQIQAKLGNQPKPLPGLGPWTIDPRDVTDRETLVRAFEYLSVFICGDGARVWNHQTIADAFRHHVPGAAPFADPLARLYALARYSPANEPIRPADIAEARGYLCRLAEVPA